MSTGRSEAKRAERRASEAAQADNALRLQTEERLRKERERSQKMFIRQVRARQGGGFFQDAQQKTTLG